MFDTVRRVNELADGLDMNLYQFCTFCGINYSTLKMAEQRNGQLKIDTIERICVASHITFAEFFNALPEGFDDERGNKSIRGG